jgi:hypothetical protein
MFLHLSSLVVNKVKFLRSVNYYAMKMYAEAEIYSTILTSALDGDEWLASCHDSFTAEEKTTGNLWL